MKGCFGKLGGCLLTLLLAGAGLLAAFYFLLLPRIDTVLADSVRREFMLPPSSTVKIEHGSLMDTIQGRVKSFEVVSDEAKIDEVLVTDLHFTAQEVQFDLPRTLLSEQAELKRADKAQLSLRIPETSVQERWLEELSKKGLEKLEVSFKDDNRVEISGLLDLKLAKLPVAAGGHFEVDGSNRVQFQATDFAVGGAELGLSGLKTALAMLTPVIDLGQFDVYVSVEEMRAEEDFLFIKARTMTDSEKAKLREEHPEYFSEDDSGRLNIKVGQGLGLAEQQARLREQLAAQFSEKVAALKELGETEQAAELEAFVERIKLDEAEVEEIRAAYDKYIPELKEKGSALLEQLAALARQIGGSADGEDKPAAENKDDSGKEDAKDG